MPRLKHSVPKYRKHRASGQAVVTLGKVDYYLGPHGTKASRLEYDRLIGEWLAGGRSPSHGTPASELTIVEMIAAYIDYAKAYYGEGSRGEYANVLFAIRDLNSLYADTPAGEFGPLQLKALRQRFIDAGGARSYINANVQKITRVFRWAAGEGLIPASVPQSLSMVDGLKRGRTEAKETDRILPVDDATIEATLPHLPVVVADMVRLAKLTGMRPDELCRLRPADIDRTGDVWVYAPQHHKNAHRGQERSVYLGPQAQSILLRYLVRDAATYCFRPCDSEAKRRAELHANRVTPLSCGNRPGSHHTAKPSRTAGEKYTANSFRTAIHRACDRAFTPPEGLNGKQLAEWRSAHRWSPNRLRHAMATAVRSQFGLEAAGVLLGHSKLETSQIYAERDAAKGVEIARLIG